MSLRDPYLLAAAALRIADAAVIEDLEIHALSHIEDGVLWCDLRPMLDPREVSAGTIDMTRQALDYALARGLVQRHPGHAHLLRVVARAGAGASACER